MLSRNFIVVPIEGLGINGRTYHRNKQVGYICFMKYNLKQLHFFDWFFNKVTYPTVLAIRKKHNNFYDENDETNEERIEHHDDKFILWGDSDIPYFQQMNILTERKKI